MGDRHALAMMEFKSIGRGLECVDGVLKGFPVELILLKIICPGKLLAAITGETAAVRGALQLARSTHSGMTYIDDFFLGNPAPGILAALRGTVPVQRQGALGIIETFTASSGLVAADTAAKAASITLVTIHLARGLAGKAPICPLGRIGAGGVALGRGGEGLGPGVLGWNRNPGAPDGAPWAAIS